MRFCVKNLFNVATYHSRQGIITENKNHTKTRKLSRSMSKRGLFKSSNGRLINADANGAFNILRKVIGNFKFDPIVAYSTPKMINLLKA